MKLYPEERETIRGVSTALRAGETTCVDILKSCFDQIERWEPQVHAWVYLDLDGANEQAQQLDSEIAQGKFRGPLHGIPIGIKDIIDVGGMPTGCGSKLWKDRIAAQDAFVVTLLRKAGAVILGKTVTTAYAWIDPPITRNPWNLERTPGGSSSGSAAAVAAGMCLGAIGTQTGGSIIRPAAFCGVAGFKPTFTNCLMTGILPFSQSLDHVGPIARSVGDLDLMSGALSDAVARINEEVDAMVRISEEVDRSSDVVFGAQKVEPQAPPRIGLLGASYLPETFWNRAEPSMRHAFNDAIESLKSAGAEILPPRETIDFDRIVRAHRTIMASEGAANHCERLDRHPEDYPPRIQSLIEEGAAIPAFEYIWAKRLQFGSATRDIEGRNTFDEHSPIFDLLREVDVLATPATLGPAPELTTTGDPCFNSPWSLFGFPTVTFPIGFAPDGLPLGIQLVGQMGEDRQLLAFAAWCERVIRDTVGKRGG